MTNTFFVGGYNTHERDPALVYIKLSAFLVSLIAH